jgi:hypothetical protein
MAHAVDVGPIVNQIATHAAIAVAQAFGDEEKVGTLARTRLADKMRK